ncbi:NADH(P)-binding-domain-containing protein [Cytidiella melzeri]|nr:NADH(P)-binding-domain-containing protein [Cytidiella melzeri]
MSGQTMHVVIVGGHGNVSMRLTRLLTARPDTHVTSIFRNPSHTAEIAETGATPVVLSLEDASVAEFADAFRTAQADVVYFSAGAGGKGGPERTKKVDEEGAIKVFDAIEALEEDKRPRLIMVSALDVRDPDGPIPEHYDETDKKHSARIRAVIGGYVAAKYAADKNLISRSAFKWTILRPGGLTHEPGTGKGAIGRTHLGRQISRDDVAQTLYLLLEREDAAGLGIDLAGGDDSLEGALDAFIKKGVSDFAG